jgi:FAD:protein FMN transferase
MGTLVTIQVVRADASADAAITRAFQWFFRIEEQCTRFDARSELMQLAAHVGAPVPVSTLVYEAVAFALLIAEESGGAFDPTVGYRMEARGFNREHRTGERINSTITPDADITYRDIQLDPEHRTITLLRPLSLDLSAVAKGLAVDTAVRELQPFTDFAIDAGGDLYLGGCNPEGEPWSVGIRHPMKDRQCIETFRVSNQAVCTSGGYERGRVAENTVAGATVAGDPKEHHILDPRTGASPQAVASATVLAPGAMLADALATAAFVLGPVAGIALLERLGVEGLIFTSEMERCETRGLHHAA